MNPSRCRSSTATTTRCCGSTERRRWCRSFERGEEGHLDLPRAREGGFAGGLFACFVPSESGDTELPAPDQGGYAVPFPRTPGLERARSVTLALAARLQRLARDSRGAIVVCRSAADIRRCLDECALAAVFHIEGA